MKKYIDVQDYCENICRCAKDKCDKDKCPIWTAPAADVVEVVRCKDCKHYIAGFCTRDINKRTNMFRMGEDDFCSYGGIMKTFIGRCLVVFVIAAVLLGL